MGTTLDPTAFPTIADNPRHQQYHIENENSEAMTQENERQPKKIPYRYQKYRGNLYPHRCAFYSRQRKERSQSGGSRKKQAKGI